MLKEVRIRYFQSHKDTVLTFGPGINIIVGEGNDIGKTALFRAIEWPVTNRPLGNGFVSNFQDGPASVELITDTARVKRIKGPKVNEYVLTAGEFEEEVFTAFGSNPPEEVVDALNILDVNIQKQQALPFLVLDSPGQVAQYIREIAKLDDIDKIITLLKSKARTVNEHLVLQKEALEEIDANLAVLSKIDVKDFELKLEEACKINEDIRDIDIFSQSILSMITDLKEIEAGWITLPENVDEVMADIDAVLKSNEKHTSRVNSLFDLVENLKEIDQKKIVLPKNLETKLIETETALKNNEKNTTRISSLRSLIDNLKSIDQKRIVLPKDLETKLAEVERTKEQYNNIEARISSLRTLLKQLQVADKKIKETEYTEIEVQKQFDELLEQLTICPMCSSKLVDITRKHLLESYKDEKTKETE